MADDFLAENNTCGQVLLHLVSRGNAIIAELLRLKDYIPPVFKFDTKQDQQKYAGLILDFTYFKSPEEYDKKIESNVVMQDLDEELRENHIDLLTRFYVAFESIHKFAVDINSYVEDLEDGVYIQQTLESVFISEDGRQLLCEAVYLFGVMLLVVDLHIPGDVRERILVSYYRYSAQRSSAGSNVDDVCKLLRSTGLISGKRPTNYPEDYFRRTPLKESLVDVVIGRLRSDDVYNQIAAYPFPEHRSTALAAQAAMLYVCLFFQPQTLHSQTAKMRNIVDKYFPDNWVVSVYMGMTVNLVDSWEPYKAAKTALANTLEPANIKEQSTYHANKLVKLIKDTQQLLTEGSLVRDNILDHANKVINLIRECNVSLRWLMLHTASSHSVAEVGKKCRQVRDQVMADVKHSSLTVFKLLLNTAELELKVKDLFKTLLTEREEKWSKCKQEAGERMAELAEVFSGTKPLTRVDKNDNLQKWFLDINKQISSLNIEEPTISGRKIVQLIQALDEVQEFHQLNHNLQVRQFLVDSRNYLHQMVRGVNVKEAVLINLQIVGDISYGWELIDSYTALMQDGIKTDPGMVTKLRATFLKLSSAMEIPLLRINQAGSSDLVSVSQYYSHELVSYVRKVLHIIPESMFSLMARIVYLQTSVIKELPTRLDKDKLREYAQLDHRMEVAKLTHRVSVFTEGVLRMKSTLVGIVRIDPKQLLEDGIRKELVHHIALALHTGLTFNPKAKVSELSDKLTALGAIMDGHRRSFEYIQDYVGIYGLKIWQEELCRVIGFNVDMECNSFLRVKVMSWQSVHQNKAIPVPLFSPTDTQSITFVGRLAHELIRITDPRTTLYVMSATSWFDTKTQKQVAGLNLFTNISSAVGISGITGLDRLISFMIVTELQNFLSVLQRGVLKDKNWLELFGSVAKGLSPNDQNVANPGKVYTQWTSRAGKVWPQVLETVLKVGQLQLIRKHIFFELRTSCKFESKNLSSTLENMNQVLLNEIKDHYKDPATKPYPREDSQLLLEISTYLDWAGIGNPFAKIYITTKNLQFFSLFTFLFVIAQLSRLQYSKTLGTLIWKKAGEPLDGMPFIVGLQTLFRQFHPEIRDQFLVYMAQYVKSHIEATVTGSSKSEFPPEVVSSLHFLVLFSDIAGLPLSAVTQHIPETIFNLFHHFDPST
ncbi:WASH complex subunit 5-like isoform X1 [Macrosteles quadrilineatus]|uniref:WASH complex subunit 5-like isoform X1 n=1 Tax=Macrosteles quadrilineatus TaxID=74068 RepID=UPI0023E34A2C|nr:WASH complex subunit 5-like isoform X1 [Macrosteles quadrilineatus]XP_054285997.1 WASH complex subunit 5-like isoform X1 [Macrosteles quadrilineatus]